MFATNLGTVYYIFTSIFLILYLGFFGLFFDPEMKTKMMTHFGDILIFNAIFPVLATLPIVNINYNYTINKLTYILGIVNVGRQHCLREVVQIRVIYGFLFFIIN